MIIDFLIGLMAILVAGVGACLLTVNSPLIHLFLVVLIYFSILYPLIWFRYWLKSRGA